MVDVGLDKSNTIMVVTAIQSYLAKKTGATGVSLLVADVDVKDDVNIMGDTNIHMYLAHKQVPDSECCKYLEI